MKIEIKRIVILIITIIFTLLGSKLVITENTLEKADKTIVQQKSLNELYSDKRLGSFVQDGKTYFRLFAPSAEKVWLKTFNYPEQVRGKKFDMIRDENGVWEASLEGELYGLYYGFRVKHTYVPGIENII